MSYRHCVLRVVSYPLMHRVFKMPPSLWTSDPLRKDLGRESSPAVLRTLPGGHLGRFTSSVGESGTRLSRCGHLIYGKISQKSPCLHMMRGR